jgi:hypothetical protein
MSGKQTESANVPFGNDNQSFGGALSEQTRIFSHNPHENGKRFRVSYIPLMNKGLRPYVFFALAICFRSEGLGEPSLPGSGFFSLLVRALRRRVWRRRSRKTRHPGQTRQQEENNGENRDENKEFGHLFILI